LELRNICAYNRESSVAFLNISKDQYFQHLSSKAIPNKDKQLIVNAHELDVLHG
jgi:hypothetical protein